jgi:asparagine synthase (glutamine-hydrolysing)
VFLLCGICGFNGSDKVLIKDMIKMLNHRGPDSSGIFVDEHVSLGHARLAIIDLSERGNQPMTREHVTIVFNGEIYNFLKLKKKLFNKYHFYSNTDTEIILVGYIEWGIEKLLSMIEGMFAFAIYDSNLKKIFLARDRVGKKPLYYTLNKGNLTFASEIKSILVDKTISREVNIEVLNQFFARRFSPYSQTMFLNIHKVMPGHYLTYSIKDNKYSIKKYWDFVISMTKTNYSSNKKELRELFFDSIKKRLISDVPIGVFLSGGLDSSVVLGAASKFSDDTLKTYSVGFGDKDKYNELAYAKKTSEYYASDHTEINLDSRSIDILPKVVWHFDEPLADPAAIPNYYLAKKAKERVSVILTGDGGDELFAGYDQYRFMRYSAYLKYVPKTIRMAAPVILKNTPFFMDSIYKYSSNMGDQLFSRLSKIMEDPSNKAKTYFELMSIYDSDERKQLFNKNVSDNIVDFENYEYVNKKYFSNKQDIVTQTSYFDVKVYLPENLLMKPDKMCMASGIEARVPFLDTTLINFSFSIPLSNKVGHFASNTKLIMKDALQDLIPPHLKKRKKQTFNVPIEQWLDQDLMNYSKDLISENRILNKHFFNEYYIKKMFSNYKNSKQFYARQIWNLINFDLWHNIFIDDKKINEIR